MKNDNYYTVYITDAGSNRRKRFNKDTDAINYIVSKRGCTYNEALKILLNAQSQLMHERSRWFKGSIGVPVEGFNIMLGMFEDINSKANKSHYNLYDQDNNIVFSFARPKEIANYIYGNLPDNAEVNYNTVRVAVYQLIKGRIKSYRGYTIGPWNGEKIYYLGDLIESMQYRD